ncbi:MAG: hypothetical protein LUG16_01110 [Candidatus Gastranaerophilales bacterium]|nr:hypothetical protein [Candidatus Gastranaerophilales bacterium]
MSDRKGKIMSRYTQKSFTGGELSPALYSRNDLAKYEAGLKTLKNGFVKAEGCISNRAGLEFICEVKDSESKSRLLPFSFNTEQTYIIELGEYYARFIKDGGQITEYDEDSDEDIPVEITTPFETDDLFDLKYAQNADVLTLCHNNYAPCELSRLSHYDWELTDIDFQPQISAPENVSAVWTGGSEHTTTYEYVVTAVKENTYEESNRSEVVSVTGELESYWGTTEYITISFSAVDGAAEYNIYRDVNGVYGFVGATTSTTFKDDKIEPDLSSTAPIYTNPFEDDNNPACVNYFQQRKVFGCLKNGPQQLVASQTSTNNNFNISRPLAATDSIDITLSEREVNEIRHIIALNDLILLTSGGEWKLNGSDGAFSASSSLVASPQSFYGCSNIQPVVSGNMILFVQSSGAVVRDLGYTYVSDSYDGTELSIFANHLFEGKQIVDMAYSKEPNRILWCVMSDGTVNALTYDKQQQIAGWHRHETKGEFESVAVIREGVEDAVYFIVKREINGETKRYIERMASRYVDETSSGIFLDSSLTYEGSEASIFSGLEHLEGEVITALADGYVIENLTVTEGKIELDYPVSKLVVGIPYEFEVETLNLEGESTQGMLKIVNSITVNVNKSREDFFVVGTDGDIVQNPISIAGANNPDYLYSGDVDIFSFSNYTKEATVHLKQIYPFPLTINSISLDVTVADSNG